jgi:hypothetical protein
VKTIDGFSIITTEDKEHQSVITDLFYKPTNVLCFRYSKSETLVFRTSINGTELRIRNGFFGELNFCIAPDDLKEIVIIAKSPQSNKSETITLRRKPAELKLVS